MNKQLHIVQIVSTLGFGGAERLVVDLSNGLAQKGHQVTIITFFKNDKQIANLLPQVNHLEILKKGRLDFGFLKRLKKFLATEKVDIVNTHLFGSDLWGGMAAKSLGLPVVVTEHSTNEFGSFWHNPVRRWLVKKIDQYVAVSETVKKYLQTKIDVQSEISVIHPGIDLTRFAKVSEPVFGECLQIAMIGRLEKEKGFDLGLRALAECKDFDWQVKIFGSGSQKNNLKKLADNLGIEKRVQFLPPTPEIENVYQATDLVIVPSRYEGFGLVVPEAMASGRLVVAAKTGGAPELIQTGVNGYLFSVGALNELKDILQTIFGDKQKAKERAMKAKEVVAHMDISTMIDKYEKLYTDIVLSFDAKK